MVKRRDNLCRSFEAPSGLGRGLGSGSGGSAVREDNAALGMMPVGFRADGKPFSLLSLATTHSPSTLRKLTCVPETREQSVVWGEPATVQWITIVNVECVGKI